MTRAARYWFRQKSFGHGATPSTWQGWALTLVSAGLAVAVMLAAGLLHENTFRLIVMAGGLAAILVPTVLIAHAKTEGGWRWRKGK